MIDLYLGASATVFTVRAVRSTQPSYSNGSRYRKRTMTIEENQLVESGWIDVEAKKNSAGVILYMLRQWATVTTSSPIDHLKSPRHT